MTVLRRGSVQGVYQEEERPRCQDDAVDAQAVQERVHERRHLVVRAAGVDARHVDERAGERAVQVVRAVVRRDGGVGQDRRLA